MHLGPWPNTMWMWMWMWMWRWMREWRKSYVVWRWTKQSLSGRVILKKPLKNLSNTLSKNNPPKNPFTFDESPMRKTHPTHKLIFWTKKKNNLVGGCIWAVLARLLLGYSIWKRLKKIKNYLKNIKNTSQNRVTGKAKPLASTAKPFSGGKGGNPDVKCKARRRKQRRRPLIWEGWSTFKYSFRNNLTEDE